MSAAGFGIYDYLQPRYHLSCNMFVHRIFILREVTYSLSDSHAPLKVASDQEYVILK